MSYLPLILGMGLVTFLPRMLPLVFLSNREIGRRGKKFLLYIPYTSLSILLTRGILTSEPGMRLPTLVGIGVSGLLAMARANLVVSVLAGILAAFAAIHIF